MITWYRTTSVSTNINVTHDLVLLLLFCKLKNIDLYQVEIGWNYSHIHTCVLKLSNNFTF